MMFRAKVINSFYSSRDDKTYVVDEYIQLDEVEFFKLFRDGYVSNIEEKKINTEIKNKAIKPNKNKEVD